MKELVKEVMEAPSCCPELKAVCEQWLKDAGTARESDTTAKLVKELEEDIMPIDMLVAFAASDAAVGIFGAEGQKAVLAHAKEIQAAGAKYCDCPACAAGIKILEKLGVR